MTQEFRQGDRVTWNTPQGETTGVVEKRLTSPIDLGGHHVAASKDNPQYLVRSDSSDKLAAHRPDALTRRR